MLLMAQTIATCCYCGARAALVLDGTSRHELSCASCGAPLRQLKNLKTEASRAGVIPHPKPHPDRDMLRKAEKAARKAAKKAKKRKRKSPAKKALSGMFDLLDDIFD